MTARIGRRALIAGGIGLAALGGYAVGVEPMWRLDVTTYRPRPPAWPDALALRVAVIADLHVGAPVMGRDRIAAIVDAANALEPDLIVLLGDFAAGHRFVTSKVTPAQTMAELSRLSAPLGRWAILGNHDYWQDPGPWRIALAQAGIPLLENRAVRLRARAGPFWLAGTASMLAVNLGHGHFLGLDDLPRTLRQVNDSAPVILLAHEPDQFPKVPGRVALTLSGHTHGGQVRLAGWSPVVPSRYGNRYAYGHVVETGRDLIVSGGLGVSIAPVRFGVPPEIVLVELGGGAEEGVRV